MEDIDAAAQALIEKEQWVQNVADKICEARGWRRETVVNGARWASIWYDDFHALIREREPTSDDEMRIILTESRVTALGRCEGLEMYPTGVPTLRTIVSAHDAFCLYFGESAPIIRQLLRHNPAEQS